MIVRVKAEDGESVSHHWCLGKLEHEGQIRGIPGDTSQAEFLSHVALFEGSGSFILCCLGRSSEWNSIETLSRDRVTVVSPPKHPKPF